MTKLPEDLAQKLDEASTKYHKHVWAYHTDMEPHKISDKTKFTRGAEWMYGEMKAREQTLQKMVTNVNERYARSLEEIKRLEKLK